MKRETGKDRWRRVPKDYFKSRDSIGTAKLMFSALAVVLSLAWWASGVDWKGSPGGSTDLNGLRANHGELNRVHSAWAEQCNACHAPFEPIDGRPLFSSKSSLANRSSDQLCMSCHAGPPHHSTMKIDEVKACAQCHRDHQGADFSLVRLNDGECTNCHGNLTAHIALDNKAKDSRQFGDVVKFASGPKDHPPFRPESASFEEGKAPVDRSKLKFSHARHMMPGIVKKHGDTPYKISDIPIEAEQVRYRRTLGPAEVVQLACNSCHVLDSTEVKGSTNPAVAAASLPARSAGRYYLPATFENSCRGCHTLTALVGNGPLEVPHGVQPDQVADFLRNAVSAQVLADDPKVLDSYVPATKIPGKPAVESTVRTKRDAAVKAALQSMFPAEISPDPKADPARSVTNQNNCVECHYYGPLDGQGIPTKVEPTKVPEIWFTHAAFDHSAHRGVSCRDCHSRSYAFEEDGRTPVKDASWAATDYLNPGIDNCVQCHAPARSSAGFLGLGSSGKSSRGASFDCTECHRYHNGDNKLQGYGASAEGPSSIRSIADYLGGAAGRSSRPPGPGPAKP